VLEAQARDAVRPFNIRAVGVPDVRIATSGLVQRN
jgi:hypothetical protein